MTVTVSPLAGHPWRRYVAMGDSITEGFGMDPVPGLAPLPWAQRLADELAATRPGLAFHNLGRRGLRAAEIRATQLERALALGPDLVSVNAGTNDLLAADLTREGLEAELEPIHAALAASGATVFTFTYMDMPSSGLLGEEGARWLRPRMEILHDAVWTVAHRHGALVVDIFSIPESATPTYFSADLQHANAAGQAFVARVTIEALARLLAERRRASRHAGGDAAGGGFGWGRSCADAHTQPGERAGY